MKTAALVTLSAFVLLVGPAAAGGIDPHDFEVDLQGMPSPGAGPQPECTSADDGTLSCTLAMEYSVAGHRMTGSVREKRSGRSGSIETTCDIAMSQRQSMRMSPDSGMEITDLSGSGSQRCSWHMDFGGGSTLTGTLSGEMRIGLASPGVGAFTGRMTVDVVAGSGDFADRVGSGTFEQSEQVPLGQRTLSNARVGAADDGSRMSVKLVPGKPRARIASPGRRLTARADGGLRVVSKPGSICRASAEREGRRVNLGAARDHDGDGLVVVVKQLRHRLGAGVWTLRASCDHGLGTATARAAVAVF